MEENLKRLAAVLNSMETLSAVAQGIVEEMLEQNQEPEIQPERPRAAHFGASEPPRTA